MRRSRHLLHKGRSGRLRRWGLADRLTSTTFLTPRQAVSRVWATATSFRWRSVTRRALAAPASEPGEHNPDGGEYRRRSSAEAFSPGGSILGVDAQEIAWDGAGQRNLNASDELVVRITMFASIATPCKPPATWHAPLIPPGGDWRWWCGRQRSNRWYSQGSHSLEHFGGLAPLQPPLQTQIRPRRRGRDTPSATPTLTNTPSATADAGRIRPAPRQR